MKIAANKRDQEPHLPFAGTPWFGSEEKGELLSAAAAPGRASLTKKSALQWRYPAPARSTPGRPPGGCAPRITTELAEAPDISIRVPVSSLDKARRLLGYEPKYEGIEAHRLVVSRQREPGA